MCYLIADANGLSADTRLVEGQNLKIPNTITNIHNNTETSRPYNTTLALGDTNPTLPDPPPVPPKKDKCGWKQIVMVVVAIVVAVVAPVALTALAGALTASLGATLAYGVAALTVAAAGSAITQTVGIGLGLQDGYDFNFREIAASAATMGVMDKLSQVSYLEKVFTTANTMGAITRAAVSSAMSVGMEKAFGVKDASFSWRNVAISGLAAGAMAQFKVGNLFGGDVDSSTNGYNDALDMRNFDGEKLAGAIGRELTSAAINTGVQKLVYQGDAHFNWASTLQEVFTPDSGLERVMGEWAGYAMSGFNDVPGRWAEMAEKAEIETAREKAAEESHLALLASTRLQPNTMSDVTILGGLSGVDYTDAMRRELGLKTLGYQPGVSFSAGSLMGSSSSTLENLDLDVFGGFSDNYIADSFESAMSDASMWRFSGPVDYFDKAASVLGAIGSAVFDQVTQPVLQTYDLFLTARGLVDSSFNPASYYASNIGQAAAGGADWTETLSMGLQSSTLGSMGYYSYAGTRDAMVGDYTESLLNFGAAGLNFLGARGVSSVASGWGVVPSGTAANAEIAAARHRAWGSDLNAISGTIDRLGQRALKQSGGNPQLAEQLFERYLGGVNNRLTRTGSEFGIEIQPAAIADGQRVPNFIYLHRGGTNSSLITGADGAPRLFAFPGSRRLDAGIIDTTVLPNQHGLKPVVAGFDITVSATKPNIVPYYQQYFGDIPIYDIRLPR